MSVALCGQVAFGQDSEGFHLLKLYTNFGLSVNKEVQDDGITVSTRKQSALKVGYPSPAISFGRVNGNFHEVELSELVLSRERDVTSGTSSFSGQTFRWENGTTVSDIVIAMRYEYNVAFLQKPEARFGLYFGVAVRPYFSMFWFDPEGGAPNSNRGNSIGGTFSVVPRLNYYISRKCFLDLNIPVSAFDLDRTWSKTANTPGWMEPTIVTSVTYKAFPRNFLVRLGVGVRI